MERVLPKHRAREYETIFILNPETAPETVEQIAGRLTDVVTRLDGRLLRAENWGRRRLAYPVRKNQKGVYIYLRYLGYEDMVLELERNMRMLEPVIKHMTVKIDEDVNPESRPVREEDISFLPQFEEEPEPVEDVADVFGAKPVAADGEDDDELEDDEELDSDHFDEDDVDAHRGETSSSDQLAEDEEEGGEDDESDNDDESEKDEESDEEEE